MAATLEKASFAAARFSRAGQPAILGPMSVAVHHTPNPNARKFVLAGKCFAVARNFSAPGPVDDPLAARLLALAGVYNVFMAQDFVTVNKRPDVAWESLEVAVTAILREYVARSV